MRGWHVLGTKHAHAKVTVAHKNAWVTVGKTVQKLARHSTITLTLDRYTHVEDSDLRDALEGKKP